MIIEAFIDCHPPTATAQHKSAVARDAGFRLSKRGKLMPKHKITFFEQGDVKEARAMLTRHFRRHAPRQPLAGPLKLTVTWTFYWNKADEAKRKKGFLPQWVAKVTRPDGDNLAKQLKDVLTDLGYWADDAHVSSETFRRGLGDRPGIHLRIEPYVADYAPPEDQPIAEVEL
jgi:Holliday junction resolvase RusA-like endonuclease